MKLAAIILPVAAGILVGATLATRSDAGDDDGTGLVAPSVATPVHATRPKPALVQPDQRVRDAVERGLRRLKELQDAESGGWIQDVGFKFNNRYEVQVSGKPHVGVTALALMAFLSGGHVPGRGKYGDVVMKGTDYVLSCVDEDTGFISANETRMYSHAFATLFLAEIYGMTHRADLKDKLQQAVDLTVKSQNKQGAWRYRPYAPDSDMSICVCQLMALRAARNIGIQVPRSTIDAAYDYIDRSSYRSGQRRGAFRYQIDVPQTRASYALTSAGLASLYHAGFYDDPMVEPSLRWLKRETPRFGRHEGFRTYFYWYGHYYAAQVMFIAADKDPGLWNDFYWPLISDELLDHQNGDGSWTNRPGPGEVFATAVACIILQIPNQYLPIFQR